jgi:hypothetical protein
LSHCPFTPRPFSSERTVKSQVGKTPVFAGLCLPPGQQAAAPVEVKSGEYPLPALSGWREAGDLRGFVGSRRSVSSWRLELPLLVVPAPLPLRHVGDPLHPVALQFLATGWRRELDRRRSSRVVPGLCRVRQALSGRRGTIVRSDDNRP